MNPQRCIVGIALPFGVCSRDDRGPWGESDIQEWLTCGVGLPCRLDHGPILDRDSFIYTIGAARDFAVVRQPVYGLLTMIEIDEGRWGDAVLRDVDHLLRARWLPPGWGLSLGIYATEHGILPYEVSLTRNPAFEDSMIIACGAETQGVWNLLTEEVVVRH